MLSRPDRFEPAGMRHRQRFLPAVIAARSRSEMSTLGSHMDIVYSTSLGVGGARRSVICPAYLPAKGRCAMMFHTT